MDKPAWKLDVEDKKIEVKPGNLTLVDEGKLSELNRSLGKVADALEKNSIGTALGTISGTLSDIKTEVTDAPPRRNVKGGKGE